jgi:hypothetical protein
MNREEFFEWMTSGPEFAEVISDEYGETVVKFQYDEVEEEEG